MVADVERYPEFINLISDIRITKRYGDDKFEADAIVKYKMFREKFSSVITLDRSNKTIVVGKADRGGAVKALENRWNFHELPDGSSLVEFYVDVKLKAFPLEMLVRDKFDKAGQHLIKVFEARARQICPMVRQSAPDLVAECARLGLDQSLL